MANQFKTLPAKPELNFEFTDTKDRRMISIRLPEALLAQVKKVAERTGWTKTEIIQLAIDRLCQAEARRK